MKLIKIKILDFNALLVIIIFMIIVPSGKSATGDEFWDSSFGVPGTYGGIYNSGCGTPVFFKNSFYVIGDFDFIGGSNISRLAKWDGTNWSPVGLGVNGSVYGLAASESHLYASGLFTTVGGLAISNFAKWDGTNWSALGEMGSALYGLAMAMVSDRENIYVGGSFTLTGQSNLVRLARWNGTNWSSIGAITNYDPYCSWCGDNAWVRSLAVKGNELYVGGDFIYAGNIFANNIVRWDGTNWYPLGIGVNSSVLALANLGDDLYVAGGFPRAGGILVNYIASWDGTNWHDVGGGTSDYTSVNALAVNGVDLYASGPFSKIGGVNAKYIAKWDGISWSPLGSGIGGGIGPPRSLAANGSELFVSGYFRTAGGIPSTNIALYHIPHTLRTARASNALTLSWPATGTNFLLESCSSLPGTNWTLVPQTPAVLGRELVVTQEVCAPSQFYRLRRR